MLPKCLILDDHEAMFSTSLFFCSYDGLLLSYLVLSLIEFNGIYLTFQHIS